MSYFSSLYKLDKLIHFCLIINSDILLLSMCLYISSSKLLITVLVREEINRAGTTVLTDVNPCYLMWTFSVLISK